MEIVYFGNQILRKKSQAVPTDDISNIHEFKDALNEMESILSKSKGVGISGVQVGILKRLIVIDRAYGMSCTPCFVKMINPVISKEEGSVLDIEGCLSFPGLVLNIKRPKFLKVLYFDENGKQKEIECNEDLSRIVSHEIDHLDGRLFTDRASQPEKLKFIRWSKKIKRIFKNKRHNKYK